MKYTKELVVVTVLSVGLAYFLSIYHISPVYSVLPLVFVAYRYGFKRVYPIGFIYGLLTGLLTHWLTQQNLSQSFLSVMIFTTIGILALSQGLFAKNVHRTLNNKRFSSVWLNIATASGLSGVAMIGVSFIAGQTQLSLLSIVVYIGASIVGMMSLAYISDKFILTRRSFYLSSKERSKLLND